MTGIRLSVHKDPEKYLGKVDLIGSILINTGPNPRSRSQRSDILITNTKTDHLAQHSGSLLVWFDV